MSNSNDSKPDNYNVNAKICHLVEQYPCMYDRSDPSYQKKDIMEKAWIQIAIEMEDTIKSCKERWRNIRTSFARSINVNKVPASANRTKPYYLHNNLQFLVPHITPGIPIPRKRRSSGHMSGEDSNSMDFTHMANESGDSLPVEVQHSPALVESNVNGDQGLCQPNMMTPAQLSNSSNPQTFPVNGFGYCPPMRPLSALNSLTPQPPPLNDFDNEVKPGLRPPNEVNSSSEIPEPFWPYRSDPDITFLHGLLPEIRAMNFQQKIKFKRGVYELISSVLVPQGVGIMNPIAGNFKISNIGVGPAENVVHGSRVGNVMPTGRPNGNQWQLGPTAMPPQKECFPNNIMKNPTDPGLIPNGNNGIPLNPSSQMHLQNPLNKPNIDAENISGPPPLAGFKVIPKPMTQRQSRRSVQNSISKEPEL